MQIAQRIFTTALMNAQNILGMSAGGTAVTADQIKSYYEREDKA